MPPRVWVLLGQGTGGNAQMLRLAEALGWSYETRQLVHSRLHHLPPVALGASRLTLRRGDSDPLEPPWPDLVIAAGQRSAPVARWIRRRSGGRTRLVHLFHTMAPLRHFDLVITLPQYRLPLRPNVLVLTGALNRMPPEELATAARAWASRLEALPKPRIALVVGGYSASYHFHPETAEALGRAADAEALRTGGSLLVSTTPRTPPESVDALFSVLTAPRFEYRWKPDDPGNPYRAYLALADRFIVTVDSASLPMEACATGRPVQVFEWPRRGGRALAPLGPLRSFLTGWGLYRPARDFDTYHRALREAGLTTRLGHGPPVAPVAPPRDLEQAVARVRALFRESPGDSL